MLVYVCNLSSMSRVIGASIKTLTTHQGIWYIIFSLKMKKSYSVRLRGRQFKLHDNAFSCRYSSESVIVRELEHYRKERVHKSLTKQRQAAVVCIWGVIRQSRIPCSCQQIRRTLARSTCLQFLGGDDSEWLDAVCTTTVWHRDRCEIKRPYFMHKAWYSDVNFGGKNVWPRRLL